MLVAGRFVFVRRIALGDGYGDRKEGKEMGSA